MLKKRFTVLNILLLIFSNVAFTMELEVGYVNLTRTFIFANFAILVIAWICLLVFFIIIKKKNKKQTLTNNDFIPLLGINLFIAFFSLTYFALGYYFLAGDWPMMGLIFMGSGAAMLAFSIICFIVNCKTSLTFTDNVKGIKKLSKTAMVFSIILIVFTAITLAFNINNANNYELVTQSNGSTVWQVANTALSGINQVFNTISSLLLSFVVSTLMIRLGFIKQYQEKKIFTLLNFIIPLGLYALSMFYYIYFGYRGGLAITFAITSFIIALYLSIITIYMNVRLGYSKRYRQTLAILNEIGDQEVINKYLNASDLNEGEALVKENLDAYYQEQERILLEEKEYLHRFDGQLEYEGKSFFDGGFWSRLGWTILGSLLTSITLGICYPVAVNMIYRWEIQHTVINGRRLSYDGKAIQLLGKWIVWWLLSIITLGIYALFVPVRIKAWQVKHSHIFGGKEDIESHFNGRALPYVGMKILTGLISLFTLGILTPVSQAIMMNWEIKHTTYNGYHLSFKGNGFALLGKYVLWFLLGIVTLGIYFLIIPIRLLKWKTKNIYLSALKEEQEQ